MQVLQLGQALSAQGLSSALPPSAQRRGQNGAAEQQTHAFWGTQPVAQFGDDPSAWVSWRGASTTGCSWCSGGIVQQSACAACTLTASAACLRAAHQTCLSDMALQAEDGPVDAPRTVADVRQEPYNLPPGSVPVKDACQHLCVMYCTQFLLWIHQSQMALMNLVLIRCRFVWSVCDMTDQDTVVQVHDLLARNYVEDDDEMFR